MKAMTYVHDVHNLHRTEIPLMEDNQNFYVLI